MDEADPRDSADTAVRDVAHGRPSGWAVWAPQDFDDAWLLDRWAEVVARRGEPGVPRQIDVYTHFPFCQSSCRFCMYFHKVPGPERREHDDFVDHLLATVGRWHARLGRLDVQNVYFGGGTPSLLDAAQLTRVMGAYRDAFDVRGAWTVEMNPLSSDVEKIDILAAHGVTRISMGVQAVDETMLDRIGRLNGPLDRTATLVARARSHGLEVNVDLMVDLPGQTGPLAESDITAARGLGADTVTLYRFQPTDRLPNAHAGAVTYRDAMSWGARLGAVRGGYLPMLPSDPQQLGGKLLHARQIRRWASRQLRGALPGNRAAASEYGLFEGGYSHLLGFGPGAWAHLWGVAWYRDLTRVRGLGADVLPARAGTLSTPADEVRLRLLAGLPDQRVVDPDAVRAQTGVSLHETFPAALAHARRTWRGLTLVDDAVTRRALVPPRPDAPWFHTPNDAHEASLRFPLPVGTSSMLVGRPVRSAARALARAWVDALGLGDDPSVRVSEDVVHVQIEPEPAPPLSLRIAAPSADGTPVMVASRRFAVSFLRTDSSLTPPERTRLRDLARRTTALD